MDKVLVTGGTGFIGLHCVQQLLDSGYEVRTTIRTESRKEEVMEAMRKHSSHPERLEIVIADLLKDDGWDEAVKGCRYVLHVASPFFLQAPDHEDDLIKPAVDGTLRVLNACRENDVEKVVLTSSVAAIAYGHGKDKTSIDETDWSKTDGDISAYTKSKTLAEKAAWDFMDKLSHDNKFELTVINPAAVTGPMLTSDIGSSNDMIIKMTDGSMPACPKIQMGFVDVRDVAKAHIFSMTSEKTNGERLIASQKDMYFVEVGRLLNASGYKKSPKREMPNLLVRIMALFVTELVGLLPVLSRNVTTDKTKSKEVFDWDYVSAENSILESAEQLKTMGLIK
jgi:dihydroflavonol-4-reductase